MGVKPFDFGKAQGFHRMYGHYWFMREVKKMNKTPIFIKNVCTNLNCKEK